VKSWRLKGAEHCGQVYWSDFMMHLQHASHRLA